MLNISGVGVCENNYDVRGKGTIGTIQGSCGFGGESFSFIIIIIIIE